jgi:hypothetical protein
MNHEKRMLEAIFKGLLQNGQLDNIHALAQIDSDLLQILGECECSLDCFEYTQPEMMDQDQSLTTPEIRNAVGFVAHGPEDLWRCGRYSQDVKEAHRSYALHLRSALREDRAVDFSKVFLRLKGTCDDYSVERTYVDFKIRLLHDDDSLQNRMELLHYLVVERGFSPPNPVDLIRWRSVESYVGYFKKATST